MSRLIVIVAGVLVLWVVFEFGAKPMAPAIQLDVQSRTEAAISAADLESVTVHTDGRDVRLAGDAGNNAAVARAGETATNVRGVRLVNNSVIVSLPYVTEFCKDESTITLSGDVPDIDAKDAFPERARDMFRAWEIAGVLTIRDSSPDGFRRFMDQALIDLGQLDEGCITLQDRDLLIKGSIRSERAALGVQQRLGALGELGFTVRYELTLPVLSDEAVACQDEANRRVATGETVLFSFDSDKIHEIGRQLLDEIVEIGKLCPDVNVLVTGHTDSVGDVEYNIELSERRAQAVVDYLVRNDFGEERLTPVGLGFSQPIADNSNDESRAMNRRIEFRAMED
jgi:OOP family OmpA-OmpF porin